MIDYLRIKLAHAIAPKPQPKVVPDYGQHPQTVNIELAVMWRGVTTHRFKVRVRNGEIILRDPHGVNTACGEGAALTVCLPDRLVEPGKLAELARIDVATVVEALD